MRLFEMNGGECAMVRQIQGDTPALRRLMEMGLLPGTRVRLMRRAPLGDPIQVRLRGYELTLRRREAAQVVVESLVDDN